MKSYALLALILCQIVLRAQIQDNFSDGDFRTNPTWFGVSSNFKVISESLWLQAPPRTDTSTLMLESDISTDALWEFSVRLHFNPSSSNFCRIYLMSNDSISEKDNCGYFLQIGGTKDDISLFRKDKGQEELLIDGRDLVLSRNSNEVNIKVSRDSSWKWILHTDTSQSGQFIEEGSAIDSVYRYSRFFGLLCRYTSTRSNKFSFDDFKLEGKVYTDDNRPHVLSHKISGSDSWTLDLSEIIAPESIRLESIFVKEPRNNATSFHFDSSAHQITFHFQNHFPHGRYLELNIDSICDTSGNCMDKKILELVYNHLDSFSHKDVLINEIMADPDPSIGLPSDEYIEIYNHSTNVITTDLLLLSDGKDTLTLPYVILNPGDYLTLIPNNADQTEWISLGIPFEATPLFSLNNSGECLYLLAGQKLIDSVCYTSMQYSGSEGGRALELINPENQCHSSSNWGLSADPGGGSPGRQNSLFDKGWLRDPIDLEKVVSLTDSFLILQYSGIFRTLNTSQIKSEPQIDFVRCRIDEDLLILQLPLNEIEKGEHKLIIRNYENCFVDSLPEIDIPFFIPYELSWNDLIINEILFNPDPGGSDFFEIVNPSVHPINLEQIMVSNGDDTTLIGHEYFLINPGEYIAFTEDSIDVAQSYSYGLASNIHSCDLPGFPDKKGNLILLSREGDPIDSMSYTEKMHFSLLDETEGISLERINPHQSGLNRQNWTSSSSLVRATPGKENSQHLEAKSVLFQLSPEIFSPNNDGYQDILSINYRSEPNHIGRVRVYDEYGRIIRDLASNELLSSKGTFYWDGLDNSSQRVKSGYYMVLFESLGRDGSKRTELATVVVAGE